MVKKLTGGLAGMAKARKVEVLTGVGSFLDRHHFEVLAADGSKKAVRFAKAVIAAVRRPCNCLSSQKTSPLSTPQEPSC